MELDPDLSREAKKDSGHVDLWAWIRARVEKKSRVEDPRRGSNTGYRRRGGRGGSALHIRERGGAEEKPDPSPPPVRIVAKRCGCISDAAASSLERLTRVCEPQLFMRAVNVAADRAFIGQR